MDFLIFVHRHFTGPLEEISLKISQMNVHHAEQEGLDTLLYKHPSFYTK